MKIGGTNINDIKVGNTPIIKVIKNGITYWEATPDADPSSLVATTISDTQINLSWIETSTNEDGFKIERSLDGITYTVIHTTLAGVTTYSDTGLTESTLYYYRVRAFKGGMYSEYTSVASNVTFPNVIDDGNTVGWYKSDDLTTITKDESNFVSRWNDKLGSGHDLIQADVTKQPVWSSTNGVSFDGIDNYMQTVAFTWGQPEFIYFVFSNDSASGLSGTVALDGNTYGRGQLTRLAPPNSNLTVSAGAWSANNYKLDYQTFGIIRILFNGANSKLIINNTDPVTGNFGANVMGGLTLGAGGSGATRWSKIRVKELICRKTADAVETESSIYNYLHNKYFSWQDYSVTDKISLSCSVGALGLGQIKISGHINMKQVWIDWGDSVISTITMDEVLNTKVHTYVLAGTYTITIYNASSLKEINITGTDSGEENVWADVSTWTNAINLERFAAANIGGLHTWTGDVSVLPISMEYWYMGMNTNFTGDMTKFINTIKLDMVSHVTETSTVYGDTSGWTKLKWYFPWGQNSFSGDMSDIITLENVYIGGGSTNTINVTNLVNLRSLEKGIGYGIEPDVSSAYYNGSLAGHTNIGITTTYDWPFVGQKAGWVCVNAPNDLEGDLTGLENLVYLSCTGNGHFSGNVDGPGQSGRLYAFYLNGGEGHHTVTGNPMTWPNLQALMGTANLTKMTRVINNPSLHTFTPGGENKWIYTEAEVNQILADFWANKDEPKPEDARSDRLIDLGLSVAPSGQGIIDRDALRLYRSPNNNPAEPVWTVTTK